MADRSLQLQQLHRDLDALVNPRRTTERVRTGWDKSRHAVYTDHAVNHPPLLDALAAALVPGSAEQDGGRQVPGSRPPLSIDALDRWDVISREVVTLALRYDVEMQPPLDSKIRMLAAVATYLPPEGLAELCDCARSWVTWCETITGHTDPLFRPDAPCLACDRRHGLRVNVTDQRAYCAHCRATWSHEEGNIGVLGAHVGTWTKQKIGA